MPPPTAGENEHHQHQHQHQHQHHSSASVATQLGGSRRGSSTNSSNHSVHLPASIGGIGGNVNVNVNARRKSALSYQQQLQFVNNACADDGSSTVNCKESTPAGRYSPHPNEIFLHHHPKLSIQPIDRYDDALACCLPPPSPAPNSDRFIPVGGGVTTTAQMQTAPIACNIGNSAAMPATGSNCLNNGQHNMHMHMQYAYDCNGQPTQQQPQQHHPAQTLSSSASTSSLSTNSGGSTCNGIGCGVNSSQIPPGSGMLGNPPHKYVANTIATMQHAISPNSRLRISDRFRELTPKSGIENAPSGGAAGSRFIAATHFPLVSSDTYTYLSSTVHTPVKRYVPTPPPPNELYVDMGIPAPAPVSAPGSTSLPPNNGMPNNCANNPTLHVTPSQFVNTLPYRLRLKCCANEQLQPSLPPSNGTPSQHVDQRANNLSVADYYATSPRPRSSYSSKKTGIGAPTALAGCSGKESPIVMLYDQQSIKPNNNSSGASTASSCMSTGSSVASSTSATASPVTISGGTMNGIGSGSGTSGNGLCIANNRQAAPAVLRPTACMLNDYVSRTPSIEYITSSGTTTGGSSNTNNTTAGRVLTPVTTDTANIGTATAANMNSSGSNLATATCLHCNTVRRTTGVHQTTQTTGPISPVPLPQLTNSNHYVNSVTNVNNVNNFQPQVAIEQISATLTPSTSESHISPLSPSSHLLHSRVQQKFDTTATGEQIIEQPQQIYVQQNLHVPPPQMQGINGAPNTATDCANPVSNCSQQQMYVQQAPSPIANMSMPQHHNSRKKRLNQYLRKEIARFFGVEQSTEAEDCLLWHSRQRRLALRRFGALKSESELQSELQHSYNNTEPGSRTNRMNNGNNQHYHHASELPDILPTQDTEDDEMSGNRNRNRGNATGRHHHHFLYADFQLGDHVERKASVVTMLMSSLSYIIHTLNKRQPRTYRQWSRSFAPAHVNLYNGEIGGNGTDPPGDICDSLTTLQEDEVFFDSSTIDPPNMSVSNNIGPNSTISPAGSGGANMRATINAGVKMIEHQRQLYLSERVHGWRTTAVISNALNDQQTPGPQPASVSVAQQPLVAASNQQHLQQDQMASLHQQGQARTSGIRGNRISAQLLDGVLENSRRPLARRVKLFTVHDLDDRSDHRPFFTYWINTVQILVLFLSLICYGIGPIGIGVEQKTGQVLVTSLSLQTVQHTEQRNVWIGPRNIDLVHMGAKFATCMRRDIKIMDVLLKTRRQERETACCIRNDDSGCVQSSQADCSVRGLFPTKSISTWKKWSPGESGPGGRISGSVCGLDPKYCDAPASIAPYEWPDDITKWPICRKTNSFSQRFRYKDHTAEHMVCEVIGHPCCTGVYGECRITTREYCDFVNGYFHEEASLCSQISCLNNVCGMFPFLSIEVPDQFYRLFTSLCLHAGILHLVITVIFQHVFLSDLERLIGPIRTAIVYIGSGLAGNLTSAVLVPYKPEVGPLASLCGVVASLVVLLTFIHWNHLRKPHVALFKLIFIGALLFGIGTLPWQLNFAGLLAGIFCGIFLTIALVPFVSISKYGRKAKINLIWSCIIFHSLVYSIMLVIFYVFPTELTNLNFGEVLSNSFNPTFGGNSATMGVSDLATSDTSSSNVVNNNNNHDLTLRQQFLSHGEYINANNIIGAVDNKLSHLRQSQQLSQIVAHNQQLFYQRGYTTRLLNGNSSHSLKNSSINGGTIASSSLHHEQRNLMRDNLINTKKYINNGTMINANHNQLLLQGNDDNELDPRNMKNL